MPQQPPAPRRPLPSAARRPQIRRSIRTTDKTWQDWEAAAHLIGMDRTSLIRIATSAVAQSIQGQPEALRGLAALIATAAPVRAYAQALTAPPTTPEESAATSAAALDPANRRKAARQLRAFRQALDRLTDLDQIGQRPPRDDQPGQPDQTARPTSPPAEDLEPIDNQADHVTTTPAQVPTTPAPRSPAKIPTTAPDPDTFDPFA